MYFFVVDDLNPSLLTVLGKSYKGSSKNVIPAKTKIKNQPELLDSRLRGSDKLGIIRDAHKPLAALFLSLFQVFIKAA